MAPLLRFLALCLLLHLSLPAISGNGIGKDELDAQKEWLLLKIDSGKELAQKDIEAQGKRLDALDKRIDDQVSRVSDIGNAVDRFSVVTGWIAILITGVLALGGLLGYLSVTKKAREEAEVVSETTSKKWFDDNHQKLSERIRDLENAVAQALEKIAHSVADVEMHRQSAINTIQNGISSGTDSNPKLSPEDEEGLRASVKQLKDKPEANYSFDDWNTRAFAAYQAQQSEDAALFWKYAAEVPNAGAANTAQALFNRAVALSDLKRDEEAIALYDQLIAAYANDKAPTLRAWVARTILNKAVTLGQMGENDEAIALYDQLIAAYADDKTQALREQVAKAILNKAVRLGQMGKNDEEIALYDQLIAAYADDKTQAFREQVAKAMGNKAVRLGQMGKNDEEIALYDQLIAAYADDKTQAFREQVAKAMGNKAVRLGQMGKNDEEIALYDQLIAAYADDKATALCEPVARAMLNKAITIGKMGRNDEEIALYDQLIAAYADDTAPAIIEIVANAVNGAGFTRLMTAKQGWSNRDQALDALKRAEADLQTCLARRPHWGMALGNLAYVRWLLLHPAESETVFRAALKSTDDGGEQLYKATLDDIALHTIPEDTAFKAMVERLWQEYTGSTSLEKR